MSGERSAVEALAEKWAGVLAEVLAANPADIIRSEVIALDSCVRELRAAIAEDEARAGQGSEAGTVTGSAERES